MSLRQWLPLLGMLGLAACELIVDFDSDPEGMLTPTPIPDLDGSVAVVVDGSVIGDGSVVRPPNDASARDGGDASASSEAGPGPVITEAGTAADAGEVPAEPIDASVDDAGDSAAVTDPELDASPLDAESDAASIEDASDDASADDAALSDDANANGPSDPTADAALSDAGSEDAALIEDATVGPASGDQGVSVQL